MLAFHVLLTVDCAWWKLFNY